MPCGTQPQARGIRGRRPKVGYATEILEGVRSQIAPDDRVLNAARERLENVLTAAARFPGALRTYRAGSLAHRTANNPVHDADGGVVLDRRAFSNLGPDGEGVGPADIVAQVESAILPELRKQYPKVTTKRTKRAIVVAFGEPVLDQDPSVDLIVALTRKDEPGLWIPNLETDGWDASHPEAHTDLILEANKKSEHTLTRVLRLAKAWKGQFRKPALSSFNLEALAMEAIQDKIGLMKGLAKLLRYGANELAKGKTEDPAGVSPALRLDDRDLAVARLSEAAGYAEAALAAEEDESAAHDALASLFFDFVKPTSTSASKAAIAAALVGGNAGVSIGERGRIAPGGDGRPVKPTRSYGDATAK